MFPKTITDKLSAVGVTMNGNAPWDPKILNEAFYDRVLKDKSLGLGESYMDGWWECGQIDELINRIIRSKVEYDMADAVKLAFEMIPHKLKSMHSRRQDSQAIHEHYDLGNDFFFSFLDHPNLQYSCGYFKDTEDLAKAQENKLDLIAEKLELKQGDTLLDIGSGWGGLSKYMAEKYGCIVTGINISKEQLNYSRELCKGLPVTFLECDYRDVKGQFDKIVSVGMFEHVGKENYRQYMETAYKMLNKNGLFLLHTIAECTSGDNTDEWLNKYIFPAGRLPSITEMEKSAENLFITEDVHNLGTNYEKTLLCWYRNFEENWPKFADKYGERFRRMWRYYLLCCAGAFRSRNIQVYQMLMTREDNTRAMPNYCMK